MYKHVYTYSEMADFIDFAIILQGVEYDQFYVYGQKEIIYYVPRRQQGRQKRKQWV